MKSNIEKARQSTLNLLDMTRRETRSLLSRFDSERVVHNDERAWCVRDIVGHLGVWNGEAARSLNAYAKGDEYICIPTDTKYYEYNGPPQMNAAPRRWLTEASGEARGERWPSGKSQASSVYTRR